MLQFPTARYNLRYVPVAVLPGLVAPLVVWPAATGGEADLARSLAALTALAIGALTRSVLGAVFSGMAVLYWGPFFLSRGLPLRPGSLPLKRKRIHPGVFLKNRNHLGFTFP